MNKNWLFEFADRFPRKIGLSYSCNINPNMINEAVVEALKSSGCVGAMFSIESADEYLRNKVLKRNLSEERLKEAGRLLNRARIPFRVGNMIGLPGENYDQMIRTLKLNINIKPTLANCTVFMPYPKLDLTKYAIENGYLSYDWLTNMPKNAFSRSVLNYSAEEKLKIRNLVYLFPVLVRFPWLYYNRRVYCVLSRLPWQALILLYEIVNMFLQRRVYNNKTSFVTTVRMGIRYLSNRQMS